MIEPGARVCPRCGEPAGELVRCAICGADLAAMRGMLPTRADWEAAGRSADEASSPAPTEAPQAETPRKGPRVSRPAVRVSRRKQVIASLGVILLFVVVLIAGTGSNPSHPQLGGGVTSPPPPATTSPTTTGSAPTHHKAASHGPTVRACAAAWNGGRSATHREDLAHAVTSAAHPVAVVGRYAGANRKVARDGGGTPVLARRNACIVAADDLVFIHQPDKSWGLTHATATHFSNISGDPTWTADHANATVTTAGGIHPSRGGLVVLTSSQLGA
jgi:hypothetical protein